MSVDTVGTTNAGPRGETSEQPLGMVGLHTGETFRLARRGSANTGTGTEPRGAESSGGVIYTDLDEPDLEALLREHQIAVAILERDPSPLDLDPLPPVSSLPSERNDAVVATPVTQATVGSHFILTAKPWRYATAGALAGAVVTLGCILLVSAAWPGGLRANPYVALSFLLGGLAFVATIASALRS